MLLLARNIEIFSENDDIINNDSELVFLKEKLFPILLRYMITTFFRLQTVCLAVIACYF